jgi:hypothetical protein
MKCPKGHSFDDTGTNCPDCAYERGAADERKRVETKAEELWDAFIQKTAIDAFGEKQVIGGTKLVNLYGSVETHRKLFLQAAKDLFSGAGIPGGPE